MHQVQQPALACLVILLEQQQPASGAAWLLADADNRILPLLPLVFHPLPLLRQGIAQLLHLLLFGEAAAQLHRLAARAAPSSGPASSSSGCSVPQPFCTAYCFAYPTAVMSVASTLHQRQASGVFVGKQVERLWRARQLCEAAGSDSSGLLQLLASPCSLPRWEADLVRASQATLRCLQPEELVAEALEQVKASQDHAQCHAALRRLKLLLAAVPQVGGLLLPSWTSGRNRPRTHQTRCHCMHLQGLTAFAAADWLDALRFLLATSPQSAEDCQLWVEMLPLLLQLVQAGAASQTLLSFAAGSAYAWVQQQGSALDSPHTQAALLPAVLNTVRTVAERSLQCTGSGQRAQLMDAMRGHDWILLLTQLVLQGGYAAKVAALQLAVVLVGGSAGCPGSSHAVAALLQAVMRHILMPRHLWATDLLHGKAAVAGALAVLLAITRALPAPDWAAAWADVGSTYFLSRAAADSCSVLVQRDALLLLAAAIAAPATNAMVLSAWPECLAVAIKAALDVSLTASTRTAALSVVAAAMSHSAHRAEEAQDGQQTGSAEEGGEQPGGQGGASCDADTADREELSLPSPQPLASAAEHLLGRQDLWDGVCTILQVSLLCACLHVAEMALHWTACLFSPPLPAPPAGIK